MTLQLFPLRIKTLEDSKEGTADLHQIARTFDGHDYAVKWADDGKGIAGSEWLGYRIANSCQIATPSAATLTDEHGRLGFGSRWESAAAQYQTMNAAERIQIIEQCGSAMTAVLALDLFCGNIDRHANNWLFTKNRTGNHTPLCIDFSRALLARGFPNDVFPMAPCHTLTTQAFLKRAGYWDNPMGVFTLEQIQSIKPETMGHWLEEAPIEWINAASKQTLLDWWGSPAYHTRLQKCFDLI